MGLETEILILAGLLLLAGFFSAAEVALISLSKFKVRQMVLEKRFGSHFINRLKEEPQRMLSTILIGNNVLNVGASALFTSMMIARFENYALGITTGVMTFLILVFGEITPKSIAVRNNEKISQFVAAPVWYMSLVLAPLLTLLDTFLNWFINLLGIKSRKKTITEEEIISAVKIAEEEGSIESIERNLINRIFRFSDVNVGEILTPSKKVVSVSSKSTVKDALKVAIKSNFSRIPVYQKNRHNVVGLVYFKELVLHFERNKGWMRIDRIMKKPYFVPDSKKISDLLRRFQKRKEHMAVVVNDQGSLQGVVTLEDILEEIVGEIMDEKDKFDPNVSKVSENAWLVQGKTEVYELNEKLKMGLRGVGYDTLSGFILKKAGRMPDEKEEIQYRNFRMKIDRLDDNGISLVKIERV